MKLVNKYGLGMMVALFLGACTAKSSQAPISVTLSENWSFKSSEDSIWRSAEVPGTVHTDLLRNGIIEDPYYRTNEKVQQWIDKKDWEYKTTFSVPDSLLKLGHLELNFQGLDTYADVYLNDQLILNADNFFRSWQVDVKPFLKVTNELRIYFHSPIKVGFQKQEKNGYGLPATNDQSENGGVEGNKLSVFTRKPGYHYGWDWGPRFVTSGIWKPIMLEAWEDQKIQSVFFDQKKVSTESAELEVKVELSSDSKGDIEIVLLADGKELARVSKSVESGINNLSVPITLSQPRLWWTYELGDPYLYDFEVNVLKDGATQDSYSEKIGIRTIELIREANQGGTSFYFKLNGTPVFAKGANYIPQDLFLPRVSDSLYVSLIRSAREANMNMLRVWGGGIYEKDLFYQLCDQEGILVWQDFMYACSMYPGDSAFLTNARLEAEENVKRLRNHPSIAIWCGNNEIDVAWGKYTAWGGWGWQKAYTNEQKEYLWWSYDTLFHKILPKVVAENTSGIAYTPTSPFDGEGRNSENSSKNGDVHYWGVWHGEHSFEEFNDYLGRFMSEFGFQSFPAFTTVKKFTVEEDWDIESNVMASHQRSGIGNLRIKSYMDKYYRLPQGFEDMLYVGQVLQAEGMKVGFEAHRRAMPYNMGSLYWQVNDCWPVASWSGMDYYMNWKGLHYFVKKAFEPVLVSPFVNGDSLKVQIVSDKPEPINGVLTLKIVSFDGKEFWSQSMEVMIPAFSSKSYFSDKVNKLLPKNLQKTHMLIATLEKEGSVAGENVFYFSKTKDLELPMVQITQEIKKETNRWTITLYSEKLARNVFLEFDGLEGHFSDNYFDLLPGQKRELTFLPKGNSTDPILKIKTIRDTY